MNEPMACDSKALARVTNNHITWSAAAANISTGQDHMCTVKSPAGLGEELQGDEVRTDKEERREGGTGRRVRH